MTVKPTISDHLGGTMCGNFSKNSSYREFKGSFIASFSRNVFVLGLGLGLTVIGLGLGLGLI